MVRFKRILNGSDIGTFLAILRSMKRIFQFSILFSLLALVGCGTETTSLPRPPGQPNGQTNTGGGGSGGSTNIVDDYASNFYIGTSGTQLIEFPSQVAGFCSTSNPSNWVIDPAGSPGLSFEINGPCKIIAHMSAVFTAGQAGAFVGTINTAMGIIRFRANIFRRLAPQLSGPSGLPLPLMLNEQTIINLLGVPNYNNPLWPGVCVQICNPVETTAPLAAAWCDIPNAPIRVWRFPITVTDPTPNGPGLSDFQYNFNCSTNLYNPGCPLDLSYENGNVVMSFKGSMATGPYGNQFYLANPEKFVKPQANTGINSSIQISLSVTSPGGTAQSQIATLNFGTYNRFAWQITLANDCHPH
jgi:hypothetical protein